MNFNYVLIEILRAVESFRTLFLSQIFFYLSYKLYYAMIYKIIGYEGFMVKFKNIEFLRIVGCAAIVLLHLANLIYNRFDDCNFFHKIYLLTRDGQKAVDLFFILSGFFFALKLNLNISIWEFIKLKLIRLYPVLFFVTGLCIVFTLVGFLHFNLYNSILSLACLSGTGLVIKLDSYTGLFWYVSSMLWTLLLFFYLRKNYDKKNINLFIALLVFFAYSFIIHAKGGKINHHVQTFNYVFNIGLLRAMGGIGLGYFIGEWYKLKRDDIIKWNLEVPQKILITILETFCLVFVIHNLMFHELKFHNQIIFIVIFLFLIVFFLIKKGYISEILNKDIFVSLAKYTYSIYMTHMVVIHIILNSLWKNFPNFVYEHSVLNFIFLWILIIFFGVFTYHFVEKPCAKYLREKF